MLRSAAAAPERETSLNALLLIGSIRLFGAMLAFSFLLRLDTIFSIVAGWSHSDQSSSFLPSQSGDPAAKE